MAARKSPGLGESLEDYVEIILALERDAGTARVRDIAELVEEALAQDGPA